MDIYKVVILNGHLLPCLLFLQQLVTISAQRTCTNLAVNDGEVAYIESPNYPSNYDSDETKCWIIEAAYPSHKIQLETVDFHLAPELYCLNDYLEIRQGSSDGKLVRKYCSSQRPRVTSTGRTLYLRFISDHTDTDRGFKLKYTSVEATNGDEDGSETDSDGSGGTDWTVAPQLYLLVIGCVVGAVFLICLVTVIVAIKSDKEPKKKKRRTRQKRMPQSQASSQQELATHIQIEHTTHNESQSVYSTLEPTAPPELPAHYGNANPSSHLETLPPSYTVAMRHEGPYMAYGNDTFGMS